MHNIIKNLHEKWNIPKSGKQPRKTEFQLSIISKLQIFGYFYTWENKIILFYSNHINSLFLLLEAVLLWRPFIKFHYIFYFNLRLEKVHLQFAHEKHEHFHQQIWETKISISKRKQNPNPHTVQKYSLQEISKPIFITFLTFQAC